MMFEDELTRRPFFEGLSPAQLSRLGPLFSKLVFEAGDQIFAAGDFADVVYLVEEGRVAIRFPPQDGGWLTIATVLPGGVVGWSAALGRPRYTSSAVCLDKVRALALRGSELRELIHSDPGLGVALLSRLAETIAERVNGVQAQLTRIIHDELTRGPS
jgi:CRP-like cAMP-binding protein